MKKISVKSNLENLYLENKNSLEDISFKKILENLINEMPQVFDFNTGKTSNLFNKKEIKNLKEASLNQKLNEQFDKVKQINLDEPKIINSLKIDLKDSFLIVQNKIANKNLEEKNQIIFLEHDYHANAYLCGFGEGNYPILKAPEYIHNYHKNEFYNGVGNIDYSPIWKDFNEFLKLLKNLKIYESIRYEEFFQSLKKVTLYKTYLLLYQAFDELGENLYENIPIKKPLFIYGNEHDCYPINIYVFE